MMAVLSGLWLAMTIPSRSMRGRTIGNSLSLIALSYAARTHDVCRSVNAQKYSERLRQYSYQRHDKDTERKAADHIERQADTLVQCG